MKRSSSRFTPTKIAEVLVPVILGLLAVLLVSALVLVALASFGIFH